MALGAYHPDHLERVLSVKQLAEWEIFYSLEPFGDEGEWIRNAILACISVNSNIPKGKRKAKLEDFIPRHYLPPKKKQSMEEMIQLMNLMMKEQKGKKRKGKPKKKGEAKSKLKTKKKDKK